MKIVSSPFPLTDLQQAYWVGEQGIYHANTPAYVYECLAAKPDLDIARLEAALLYVVRMHPVLRTRINADGTQVVVAPPERIEVEVNDFSTYSMAEKEFFECRKSELEERLPPLDSQHKFFCAVDRAQDGYYIHFLFRLIGLDGKSIVMFFQEMASAYIGRLAEQSHPLPEIDGITPFERFVRRQIKNKQTEEYRHSFKYWQDRMSSLPGAPDLPIVDHEAMPTRSQFVRKKFCLEKAQIDQLAMQARKCGVTMTVLLCTVYTDVLRMWSRNTSFSINMLMSHRPSDSPEYARVLGNFTNTILLEVAFNEGDFIERARAIEKQLNQDIIHASVSGVELIRSMRRTGESVPAMPIVFASMLGYQGPEAEKKSQAYGGIEGAMHTPQVWIDHQAYYQNGQLNLNWDVIEGVFQPGVIDQMFATYERHLGAILSTAIVPGTRLLPTLMPEFLQACNAANDTKKELQRGLLHDFYADACRRYPERTAIIAPHRELTYDQLWRLTTRLAKRLRTEGIGRNNLVAIVAKRGWRQVGAAMAVVQSGGAYLPVSSDLPQMRQSYLIGRPGVKAVLAERALIQGLDVPPGVKILPLEEVLPDGEPGEAQAIESIQGEEDLAYVIFTSGSTGQPKGVAIDHRGAVNTVQDIIARFGLTCDDRVIGISAFNFDLSVYDIFGTLGCGAALVLPPHSATPSPEDWAHCVKAHGVTVWNSVPALLEMQLEFLGAAAVESLGSLRLVMLSGDWIPVSLPGRLRKIVPDVTLIGMGGATEASIWSNYFVIDKVDPSWKSIPYGWPLSNQTFHVLGPDRRPAPVWVVGELYIGGVGLAQGYYQDPQRTAASFIRHPEMGKRLYRTGDLGRYHPSGYIEFLGRNDNQVKIRGFRIELGEIDTAVERCPGIRSGAAVVRTSGGRDKQLVAFYVRNKQFESEIDEMSIRRQLEKTLPDYMVPSRIFEIEQMPVTANGKIDRGALLSLASHAESDDAFVGPRNETEKKLAELWKTLLGCESIGVHDSFFAMGGTSLMAVRLMRMVDESFGTQLPLASLLRHSTVAAQAELLANVPVSLPAEHIRSPIVHIRCGDEGVLLAVHPVGGNVLCYRDLIEFVPPGLEIVGLQSSGNGKLRTVSELAATYVSAVRRELNMQRPLYLLGWSMGGVIAHEMTRLFESMDMPIASLTMIESWMGDPKVPENAALEGFLLLKNFVRDFLNGAALPSRFDELEAAPDEERISEAINLLREAGSAAGQLAVEEFASLLNEHRANYNALIHHRPGAVNASVIQFRGSDAKSFPFLEPFKCPGDSNKNLVSTMNEDHFSIMRRETLQVIVANTFSANLTLD